MPSKSANELTIGVFDSGFGGLTVLRALLPLIPTAHYIYLGDTARLPYGSKSRETIARYAVSSAKYLHEQGADLLVIACNTATALAFEDIQQALPIPVIGVIQPGAEAALNASKNIVILSEAKNPRILHEAPRNPPASHVLVLATAATVQSHAYTQALTSLGLEATEKACPLLVPLVEEGWINHPVTDEVLKIYLQEALAEAPATQTLLLGCTHYPLLEPAIHRVLSTLNHPLTVIDSAKATAQTTAKIVATHFHHLTAQRPSSQSDPMQPPRELSFQPAPERAEQVEGGAEQVEGGAEKPASLPTCTFYATDSIEKFQRLGSAFLGQPLSKVHLLDLGG